MGMPSRRAYKLPAFHRTSQRLKMAAAIGAIAAIAAMPVSPASAQAAGPADPSGFAVAGVKLGMTPAEAVQALKAFDPALQLHRRLVYRDSSSFGELGEDETEVPARPAMGGDLPKSAAIFVAIEAKKGMPVKVCMAQYRSMPTCEDKYKADEETIDVWFSPAPGQQRVTGVQRTLTFHPDPHPAVATLQAGLFGKYPKADLTLEHNFSTELDYDWAYDSRHRLMSKETGRARGLNPSRGQLPQFVNESSGVTLSAYIHSYGMVLADQMSVILYDGGAMYRAANELHAAYQAQRAAMDAKAVDAANKAHPAPKF
jgi:hypothetical protein